MAYGRGKPYGRPGAYQSGRRFNPLDNTVSQDQLNFMIRLLRERQADRFGETADEREKNGREYIRQHVLTQKEARPFIDDYLLKLPKVETEQGGN